MGAADVCRRVGAGRTSCGSSGCCCTRAADATAAGRQSAKGTVAHHGDSRVTGSTRSAGSGAFRAGRRSSRSWVALILPRSVPGEATRCLAVGLVVSHHDCRSAAFSGRWAGGLGKALLRTAEAVATTFVVVQVGRDHRVACTNGDAAHRVCGGNDNGQS